MRFATPERRLAPLAVAAAAGALLLAGCQQAAPGAAAPADTPPRFSRSVADRAHTESREIARWELPAASGGNGALSYHLEPAVPGLTFDGSRRTLAGTPSRAGEYSMTYRVEDADANRTAGDADTLTFTIEVCERNVLCYPGSGNQVFILDPPADTATEYELRVDTAPANVYLIVTNTDSRPSGLTTRNLQVRGTFEPLPRPAAAVRQIGGGASLDPAAYPVRRDRPWVVEFNANPPPLRAGLARTSRADRLRQNQAAAVTEGAAFTFLDYDDSRTVTQIAATARKVVSDGAVTLAVWVADANWGRCPRPPCVTQTQVDTVARTFLRPGSDNDVYDWVTAIFGAPWGPHRYIDIISAEQAGLIHILLYDIDDDGLPTSGDSVRTVGYFFAKDNLLRDPQHPDLRVRTSNERLMFYADAVLLASPAGASWEATDRGPSLVLTTLAHEFQHMIHYYQKPILRDAVAETWLNEMSSAVAEDLLAGKLRVDAGPRGVAHDDPTAGAPGNTSDRLSRYNRYNYIQVTTWNSRPPGASLKHYSINYALGAYLARTHGGAALFGDIVRNRESGVAAIDAALAARGAGRSFGDVLVDWGIANLLSDDTGAPDRWRYNTGGWRTSGAGGSEFRLGSINLFNYQQQPAIFPFRTHVGLQRAAHSNLYLSLGRLTESIDLGITTDPTQRFTVVMKE